MERTLLLPLALSCAVSPACGGQSDATPTPDPLGGLTVVSEDPSDLPLDGLSDAWMDTFVEGDAHFEASIREAQGLGPLYIRQACASCHEADSKGPGTVTKMVVVEADGFTPAADQSALPWGHTVRPLVTAGATTAITPPEGVAGLKTSVRVGPPVFGRGYLEAIKASEIERLAQEQAQRTDGISGRVHYVAWGSEVDADPRYFDIAPGALGLIGRFGVKARQATLDDFTADAYQGDMGLTSPYRSVEPVNPDGLTDDALAGLDLPIETVRVVADYVRLIDIPAREGLSAQGRDAFDLAKCGVCHTPSLATREDYPIEPLAGIDAPVFTDLLLHDMGSALADGMTDGEAGPREWRTAPLMGLRHMSTYLHDGRARTVEEAILAHRGEGSEANVSIDAYDALTADQRQALITYVEAL